MISAVNILGLWNCFQISSLKFPLQLKSSVQRTGQKLSFWSDIPQVDTWPLNWKCLAFLYPLGFVVLAGKLVGAVQSLIKAAAAEIFSWGLWRSTFGAPKWASGRCLSISCPLGGSPFRQTGSSDYTDIPQHAKRLIGRDWAQTTDTAALSLSSPPHPPKMKPVETVTLTLKHSFALHVQQKHPSVIKKHPTFRDRALCHKEINGGVFYFLFIESLT